MHVSEWLGENNKLGIDIWNRKYRYNDEDFETWLDRVSGGNEEIKRLIKEKKFLFGGRILANRGLQKYGRKITLSNCFLPNQKVLTDKGYKNIQDICVGDKVLTHTNKYQTVNAVLQRDYQGEIYIITPRYGTGTVKCTPNHEFLTNRGWVRAEDLRVKSDNHAVRNGLRYDLILMNSSKSGWVQSIEIINAPLRPCCPINSVTKLYKSMNETAPVVSLAALFILAPLGASFDTSMPQPPPYE